MIKWLFLFFAVAPLAGHERPADIHLHTWTELEDYFLPQDHFLRPTLDRLFAHTSILESDQNLVKAGFTIIAHNHVKGLVVAKHKKIEGYVVKMFTRRSKKMTAPWQNFKKRCRGARALEQLIDYHDWGHQFRVPTKWIYFKPPKHFVLIAEDVQPYSGSKQRTLWKSSYITPELLIRLSTLIKEAKMADSTFPDNIPICKDGRIAFVDTEHYQNPHIAFLRLLPCLSPDMQKLWKRLWHQ